MKKTGFFAGLQLEREDKVYIAIIAAAVVLCIVFMTYFVHTRKAASDQAAKAQLEQSPQVIVEEKLVEKIVEKERVITADIIQDGLTDMGDLITEEYYFTEVVDNSKISKLFGKISLSFTEASYVASYDGVITAGIDFTKIRVVKDETSKVITVLLPSARICQIDVDPESFQLYSEKTSSFNQFSAEDFNAALIELEATAQEKAISRGLLKKADENGQKVIRNFISGLVDTTVYEIAIKTID